MNTIDHIGEKIKAGRYKSVTLEHNRMRSGDGYTLDRRLLGTVLYTVEYRRGIDVEITPLAVLLPVSATRFLVKYNGRNLSIGCYDFSVQATRTIRIWALAGMGGD